MVGEISDWRKPIQLHMQFSTPNGYLNIRATGKGIRKFEKKSSLAEQINILKGIIARNKKYVVECLHMQGMMDDADRERYVRMFQYDHDAELDCWRIEDGLYEQLSFSSEPLTYDPPIYAGDLKNAYTPVHPIEVNGREPGVK